MGLGPQGRRFNYPGRPRERHSWLRTSGTSGASGASTSAPSEERRPSGRESSRVFEWRASSTTPAGPVQSEDTRRRGFDSNHVWAGPSVLHPGQGRSGARDQFRSRALPSPRPARLSVGSPPPRVATTLIPPSRRVGEARPDIYGTFSVGASPDARKGESSSSE